MKATTLFSAVTVFIAAWVAGGVTKAADDVEAMTTAAVGKWKAQREGAVTGRFSVRLYRYTSLAYTQKIPAEKFRALIDGKDAAEVEAALGKLQGLRGEALAKGFKPHWGVPIEISCEGIKWRNEWKGSRYKDVYVFNGDDWLAYEGGIQQATLKSGRGRLEAFTFEKLCVLPKESLAKEILGSSSKRFQGGRVTVDIAKQKFIFDPTTGFMDLHTFVGSQKRLREIHQAGPIQLEGGFVLPRAKVRVEYEGSHVESFDVLLIDKAELNVAIPPETFVVSAPGKTTIVDTREKTQTGFPIRVVKDAVPDVLTFADAGELKRIPELELPQRSRNRWLYVLFTLPLLILAGWSLIRRWKSRISNG